MLAVSTGLVFAVGALVSVFVMWAAFTLAFALANAPFMSKHMIEDEKA